MTGGGSTCIRRVGMGVRIFTVMTGGGSTWAGLTKAFLVSYRSQIHMFAAMMSAGWLRACLWLPVADPSHCVSR